MDRPELFEAIRRHTDRAEESRRRGEHSAALFWDQQAMQARALMREGEGLRCPVCGGSGVQCCEFGADR